MSAVTLLIVNGACSFIGAAFGAFMGVVWFFRKNKVEVENADDF